MSSATIALSHVQTHQKKSLISSFISFSKKTALLQLALWSLLTVELLLFVLFFSFWLSAFLLTLAVAFIFSTLFGSFLLKLYKEAKLPEKCLQLARELRDECGEGSPQALAKAAALLQGKESRFYKPPRYLNFLSATFKRFSSTLHTYDCYKMRETLLLVSIDELLFSIKKDPLSLSLHASLANAYVMLAALYKVSSTSQLPNRFQEVMKKKFKSVSYRAIEEFKILKAFAPDDPWIREQLAISYHDLEMPKEEIVEYECLIRMQPKNEEALLRLGILYFQEGESSKALAIYQFLLDLDLAKAEMLINHYGTIA